MENSALNCPSCKNNIFEADSKCEMCGFPLKGTEKQKAQFIGLKYAKKIEGGDIDKTVAIARFMLFIEAGIHFALMLVPYMIGILPVRYVNYAIFIAVVLIALGVIAKHRPIIGFSISLPLIAVFLFFSFALTTMFRHDTHLLQFVYIDMLVKFGTIVMLILGIIQASILKTKDKIKYLL